MQGSKPWRYTGKEEHMEREDIKMLVNRWWEIYNDESLDYNKKAAVANADPVNILAVALSGSAAVLGAPAAQPKRAANYLMAPPAA